MSGPFKKATGLTGLAVSKTPKKTLNYLYSKILKVLEKMPTDAAYRNSTETIVKERFKIVNETNKIEEMEKKINCGIIEDVIIQAENELILARKMLVWKPWEPLMRTAPLKQWDWPPVKSDEPIFQYPPEETAPSSVKPACENIQFGAETKSAPETSPTEDTKPTSAGPSSSGDVNPATAAPSSSEDVNPATTAPSSSGDVNSATAAPSSTNERTPQPIIKVSDITPPIELIRASADEGGDLKLQINEVKPTHGISSDDVIEPADRKLSTNEQVGKESSAKESPAKESSATKSTVETSTTSEVIRTDIKKPFDENKTGDCKPVDLKKFQEDVFETKSTLKTKSKFKVKVAKVQESFEKKPLCDPVDIEPRSTSKDKVDKTKKLASETKVDNTAQLDKTKAEKPNSETKIDNTTKLDKTKMVDAKPSITEILDDKTKQSLDKTKPSSCKPVDLSRFDGEKKGDDSKPNDGDDDKTPPKHFKIVKTK